MSTDKKSEKPDLAAMLRRRLDMEIEPALIGQAAAIRRIEEKLDKVIEELVDKPTRGQPDWIRVDKPKLAEAILIAVDGWVGRYGLVLGLKPPACWRWHPDAVSVLLVLMQFHGAAYGSSSPKESVDFWKSHLPWARNLLVAGGQGLFGACRDAVHVVENGGRAQNYAVHSDELPALAAWWAADRTGLAPGLSPVVADARRAS